MKRFSKVLATLAVVVGMLGAFMFIYTPTAFAAACAPPNSVPLKSDPRVCCPPGTESDQTKCMVEKYVNPTIKVLSWAAGVAVVIGMTMGAIQYSASGGDPQKAALGKSKIVKSLFGLFGFMFLYGALQFFSPGGIGTNAGPPCAKTFLGLKPWFAYLDPAKTFEPGTCNIVNFDLFGSDLPRVLLVVADDLIRIAGLVAVAYVIMGGIQFVTSSGDPERTKKARETVINALIGVVIAIVAASVVSFIGGKLTI